MYKVLIYSIMLNQTTILSGCYFLFYVTSPNLLKMKLLLIYMNNQLRTLGLLQISAASDPVPSTSFLQSSHSAFLYPMATYPR